MRPREWVRCDKPWSLFIHEWGVVDPDARVQADGPWSFKRETAYWNGFVWPFGLAEWVVLWPE